MASKSTSSVRQRTNKLNFKSGFISYISKLKVLTSFGLYATFLRGWYQSMFYVNIFFVKVDMSNSVAYFNHTPIFECYVIGCGSKNKYQKKKNVL